MLMSYFGSQDDETEDLLVINDYYVHNSPIIDQSNEIFRADHNGRKELQQINENIQLKKRAAKEHNKQ